MQTTEFQSFTTRIILPVSGKFVMANATSDLGFFNALLSWLRQGELVEPHLSRLPVVIGSGLRGEQPGGEDDGISIGLSLRLSRPGCH